MARYDLKVANRHEQMSFTPKKIAISWSPDADTHTKFQQLFDLLGLEDEIFEDDEGDQPDQEGEAAEELQASPVKVS